MLAKGLGVHGVHSERAAPIVLGLVERKIRAAVNHLRVVPGLHHGCAAGKARLDVHVAKVEPGAECRKKPLHSLEGG